MTTAHRPTWKAAVGQSNGGGWTAGGAATANVGTLALRSHTQLKVRQGTQLVDRDQALKESLKKLEEAEKKAATGIYARGRLAAAVDPQIEEEGRLKLLKQTAEVDIDTIKKKYDDEDAEAGDDSSQSSGWSDIHGKNNKDDSDGDDLDASSSEEEDSDDDDDDEAALQAELAKIRAERAERKVKEEAAQAAVEESKLEEAALIGNPLLNETSAVATTGKLKRKWNDDVVFRNQARGEPKIKKRFINDTVRSDFHRRFLNKFIR